MIQSAELALVYSFISWCLQLGYGIRIGTGKKRRVFHLEATPDFFTSPSYHKNLTHRKLVLAAYLCRFVLSFEFLPKPQGQQLRLGSKVI